VGDHDFLAPNWVILTQSAGWLWGLRGMAWYNLEWPKTKLGNVETHFKSQGKIMHQLKMRPSLAMAVLLCLGFANPAQAETQPQKLQAEKLAQQLSEHYASKNLAKLDDASSALKAIELVYEHSLGGRPIERLQFKNFAELEAWLQKKEIDSLPGRKSEALKHCQKGMCQYAIAGLLHNQLYLKGVSYVYLNGKPVVKALYLLDGD